MRSPLAESPNDRPVADSLCTWDIPLASSGAALPLAARRGQATVIVGANGSGKSALGYWLQRNADTTPVHRLIAHRKLWFPHAGPSITSAERHASRQNMASWNVQAESRYVDHADSVRSNIVLFDLLSMVNYRNAMVAELHDAGVSSADIDEKVDPSPLARLNAILEHAGLAIRLELTATSTFDAVKSSRSERYPISHMSDGEKSAVLLAAEILAADKDSVLVIDEPERHLHRAISAALIESVIASRPDCHFVILTHDLDLASQLDPTISVLYLLSDCTWSGPHATGWRLDQVHLNDDLPDQARKAILGGRRQILFVEGDYESLDSKLYGILFPGWTLVASGSCEQVIRSVDGLAANSSLHWVEPRGIVDNDGRSASERLALAAKGILVLPVSEVESLYYCNEILDTLARQQSYALGEEYQPLLDRAVDNALRELSRPGTPERLAASVARKTIGRKLFDDLPSTDALSQGMDPIVVTMASPYPDLLVNIRDLLDARNLDGLVELAPIRDTPMRAFVARALKFQTYEDYQSAVCARLANDAGLAQLLRDKVGPLPTT
jgi:ABC-type lipoprotein export system ATPase subunit